MEIGHVIAQLRAKNKISQRELAKQLNTSPGVIGMWETNSRLPSYEYICALADYFCISLDTLCEHDRKLSKSDYLQSEFPDDAIKLINVFLELNEENRDILIGEARKLLKEQRIESESSLIKKAT